MRTIAVTTRVTITATEAAPASADVDFESLATIVESPTCAESVSVAIQENNQQLIKTTKKL